jgi:hypothetical protein
MGDHKHRLNPPLYRTLKRHRWRFLTATEVRRLRDILYSTTRWRKLLSTGP